MHYTKGSRTSVNTGTHLHLNATVDEYDPASCLFPLDPVATTVREVAHDGDAEPILSSVMSHPSGTMHHLGPGALLLHAISRYFAIPMSFWTDDAVRRVIMRTDVGQRGRTQAIIHRALELRPRDLERAMSDHHATGHITAC